MKPQVPSESYATIVEADAYHAMRPSAEKWSPLEDEKKAQLLVAASDFLDDHYPLKGNLNERMRTSHADIPVKVKRAVYELAIVPQLTESRERDEKMVKVSSITIQYDDGLGDFDTAFDGIKAILRGLLQTNDGYRPMLRG